MPCPFMLPPRAVLSLLTALPGDGPRNTLRVLYLLATNADAASQPVPDHFVPAAKLEDVLTWMACMGVGLLAMLLIIVLMQQRAARLRAANEVLRTTEQELRASLKQERELNQLKASFANSIAHEFRTPLGVILFASSMLRRFNHRFGPQERAEQFDAIDDAVKRMDELVDQALSLGRAEVIEPEIRDMDPMALCRCVVDEVQSATSHRCRVWLSASGSYEHGRTDESRLRLILANLLGNAVKYSPAGSKVILRFHREETLAVFTVRDFGPGLKEEDIPELFCSFRRGKDASGTPGTGLGLAIVKRCVESIGGSVTACNASGGGAEFTVRLPMFPTEAIEAAAVHPHLPLL